MAEETSQPNPALNAEDPSQLPSTTTAPVHTGDSGFPAANTPSTTTPPTVIAPVAGSADTGGAGEEDFDYEAAKSAYLNRSSEDPGEPEAPIEPPPAVAKLPAIRVRPYDPETANELSAFKAYKDSGGDLSLSGWARSVAFAANEDQEAIGDDTSAAAPQTVAGIRSRMEAINLELVEAGESFALDRIAALQAESNRLALGIVDAMRAEEGQAIAQHEARSAAQIAFEAEVDGYAADAASLYGDAVFDGASALSVRASEILTEMQAAGDPTVNLPVATMVIYTRAARELGVAPASTHNQPARSVFQTSSPVPPVAPPSILAGGDTRSSTATRSAIADVNHDNYDQVKAEYMKRIGRAA